MQGKHQYIDAAGRVVTEDEAVDERGLLRQGMGIRSTMFLADGAAPGGGHVAGFQHFNSYTIAADAAAIDDRAKAYATMKANLQDAWRHPTQANITDVRSPAPAAAASISVADAQAVRDQAYVEYVTRLSNQWRSPA